MYFFREIENELENWKNDPAKKPLLIRGARQVGKSSTIKHFGKKFQYFLEINFDANPEYNAIFEKYITPKEVCEELSIVTGNNIIEGKTLLFFDEIQLCPRAISSLRYFYEQMPSVHVIATGSLLEFALSDLPSFGVGRIHSIFMYPFSFKEFLRASENSKYIEVIQKASPTMPVFDLAHQKLKDLLKKFMIIGGMPEAVATYIKSRDLQKVQRVLSDIVNSYQTDFSKYKDKVPAFRVNTVLREVAKRIGSKFMYSDLTQQFKNEQIKESLELLRLAGLIYPSIHSSANGIPIGAEIEPKKTKYLIFDTGIYLNMLGLNLGEILLSDEVSFVNKGNIAELFVGIEIVKNAYQYVFPELYYWHRESRNSQAEVDYVIQKGEEIIPIEVKAGKSGASEYEKIKVFPLYAVDNIFNS
jgi:predicted AAA+ superfamily ATPase